MTRRLLLFVMAFAATAAACNGPAKPSTKVTLTSLSISGQTVFSGIGQAGQLTVFGNYSDGSRQDVTSQVTFAVQNPSVATVSAAGAVKIVGFGSTSVTATLQPITATVNLQVTLILSSLTVAPTTVSLAAVGQTQQVTLTATYVDGSTKDVSGDAAWTSSAPQIASVNGGLVTATGLGATSITARYPASGSGAQSKFISIVITPPGTFVLSGGTRDPGNGPLGGVTIVHKPSGLTTTSNGAFSLAGLTDGLVTFDHAGYEPVVIDTNTITGSPLKSVDVPMQPVTRINAGESVSRTIAPHDMDFPVAAVHCYPCQMIRVTTSTGGTLHLETTWSETHSKLHMWINGVDYPGTAVGPSTISADVVVNAGELLVYVGQAMNNNASYVPFTLATSMH